jgi:serine/threonine protein kinase
LSREGVTDTVQTRHICGTPEYLSPEILAKQPHGKAVDWYTLGALCYEMLTGLPPFYTKDREKLFERIRTAELPYPTYLSPEARSLLEGLLQRDPARRLGSVGDAEEIKNHPFFAGTDWNAVYEKRYVPPFKPTLTSDTDVQYFDKEFVSLPVINSLEPNAAETLRMTLGQEVAAGDGVEMHFEGFTYQPGPKLA